MTRLQKHRNLYTATIAALILLVAIITVFWARGFKPDFRNGKIGRTGLIVATSVPQGAQVYLNDRLTSATDTNIAFLDPKTYKVRIQKDGYSEWVKDIEVKADLSVEIKAILFPTAPQISPLSNTGASSPTLSPDGTKIVYGVAGQRGGLMLISMAERPFLFRQDAKMLVKNAPGFDFTKSTFIFAPDSKQGIATVKNETGAVVANILVDTERSQQEIRDVTASLNSQLAAWQEEIDTRSQTQALTLPDSVKNATVSAQLVSSTPLPSPTATSMNYSTKSSAYELITMNQLNYYPTGLKFSPDDEKVLYRDKNGKYNVYDIKTKKQITLPDYSDLINLSWFPDSTHLVVAQKDQISILEADGNNKMVIYSGKFENGFVYPHPSGSRLIILTTLTQPDGTSGNLYAINLK